MVAILSRPHFGKDLAGGGGVEGGVGDGGQ